MDNQSGTYDNYYNIYTQSTAESSLNDLVADIWVTHQVTERVEAGAEFLDKKKPGWHKLIDISELDIESGNSCICGQVFLNEVMNVNDIHTKWADEHYHIHTDEFFDDDDEPPMYDDGYDYAVAEIIGSENSSQSLGFNCSYHNKNSRILNVRIAAYNKIFNPKPEVQRNKIEYELLAQEWILQIAKRNAMEAN